MASRIFRFISLLSIRHPVPVLIFVAVLSVVLGLSIRNLKLATSLTDLFGQSTPQWEAVRNYTQSAGYGNQLFVIIESKQETEEASQAMEALADRLAAEMKGSGYFSNARCSLTEKELLDIVRLFAWNFPYYAEPRHWDEIRARFSDSGIKAAVARGRTGLVTAFSSLGTGYFVTDPLGLTEIAVPAAGVTALFDMDLAWGSGNYFFSKDHKALLLLAEPKSSGLNYQNAREVVKWVRERGAQLLKEEEFSGHLLSLIPAGALVFAEQDRGFIEKNINLVSMVSVLANLILCLLVYRRIPIFLMSFVPTFLGLVWTTGIISYYPGELNLISLSFIAILVGLGDDNIVHFFNRVPQEWTGDNALDQAMARTLETTGRSVIFCIVTTGTATLALATAKFKGLSEFGFVLTIGLLMLMVHTLFTVPAMMHVWWRIFPPRAPESTTFRFLPRVAAAVARMVSRKAGMLFWIAVAIFVLALSLIPFLKMEKRIEIIRTDDNPAVAGQRLLSEKFSVAGTPGVILMQGGQQEVLRKTEELAAALENLRNRGIIKSVFSPTYLVPSQASQIHRSKFLSGLDLERAAGVLERALIEAGFELDYFKPALNNLRRLGKKESATLTAEDVLSSLPEGLLQNSIQKIDGNRYLVAVAYYSSNEQGMEEIPEQQMAVLQKEFGPFVEFSYPKLNRELQEQILKDNRKALLLTSLGIVLIVFLCFRRVRTTLLVLTPIVFAIFATYGLLIVAGHRFSFMALTAIPLITGLGIDNGIHLTRRFLEKGGNDIVDILRDSGPALLQSNLTTMLGFGALLASSFEPLAELGLVTAIGVGFTLAGAMLLLPAMVLVFRIRQ
jgi:predicted RND superfamily exporter protein